MAKSEKLALLSVKSSPAFAEQVGHSTGVRRLSWESIAAALANPQDGRPVEQRPPVAEFGRLLVLGETTREERDRLARWVGGTEREAWTALVSVVCYRHCPACKGLGESKPGEDCPRCDGTGVKLLGERAVSSLLGVSRHAHRKNREAHERRVDKVMRLWTLLDKRLGGA